ncbi:phosphoribosyltransferase [Treponema pectinovorum]|uniref:phosphoribosyltransferase n=1 Tax=Treponema pectinovorum TaxID=164 RepID=UPI0011F107FC|nr:phosphoribosyltransferase family protein [Treponema pectinovorum]
MLKEFLPYDTVRNDALKLGHKILQDGFIPDIIYTSLRGGAYMSNVISEYFKLALRGKKPVLYAAVVARSYSDIKQHEAIRIDGWTYSPEFLRPGDKILLVDDIYDSGRTLNFLVEYLLEKGVPRSDIKVVVHDFKNFIYKETLPIKPDYWCRKFDIEKEEDDRWIHYMSHELVGLKSEELEEFYFKNDPELRNVLGPLFK